MWMFRCYGALALVACVIFLTGCSSGSTGDTASGTSGKEQVAAAKNKTLGKANKGRDESTSPTKGKKSKKKRRESTTTVNVARVIRDELVVPVVAEGSIRARKTAEVRSEISGRITHFYVQEGDVVKKGQKIADLDGREYSIAMEEAHSRYLKALGAIAVEEDDVEKIQNQKNELSSELDELEKLQQRGTITLEERRERELALGILAMRKGAFRRELVEARAGLAQARADEERAKLNLSRTNIRAPFTSVVSNLTLTAGHHLTTGETICKLVDNVDVEAEVGVLESNLGGLEVGRPALLIVPALSETLRVRIDVISPEIESDSRTCRVLMRLKNKNGHLRPGMFVRASIAGKIYKDRLLVPNEAILTRDGRPMLFKVEEDRAKWVYVKTGLRNDDFTEIRRVTQGGPLDPGTLVVISNHLTLSHDAKIKVRRIVDSRVTWTSDSSANTEN